MTKCCLLYQYSWFPGISLLLSNGSRVGSKKLLKWSAFILKFETSLLFIKTTGMTGIFTIIKCFEYWLVFLALFLRLFNFKVRLLPSKKAGFVCFNESQLKMVKNAVIINVKSSFHSWDIKVLVQSFVII